MTQKAALPRPELVMVADTVAREKNIEKEDVFQAMETAIEKAGRSKYGLEHDIRATIDRKNGEIKLMRYIEVVEEEVENQATQMLLSDAKRIERDIKVGEFIINSLPPIDFGRIAAQTAKQVITQRVREAERNKQFEEFEDKIGQVVNGVIKRVEFGNAIVDLGRAEAILRRDEIISKERFSNGDRVRAYIIDVRKENRGPQIFLSRTCPEFMAQLFKQEVPEIYDGIVEIKGVARDPGSKAKIAVTSNDSSIDPVGACVGLRGVRVQAVVNELQGEKVDIIKWSPDMATYIVNTMSPTDVQKVVIDEEKNKIEVVVGDDQLSLAIGRRGQNVRLAAGITGKDIDILSETQDAEKRQSETKLKAQRFIDALDVDDMIAHLLVAEGFNTIDDVALIDLAEIAEIEGFDEDIATELQNRALAFIKTRNEEFEKKQSELGISEELISVQGLDQTMLIKLAEAKVKTLDDLGDLAGDELVEIVGAEALTNVEANEIIMAARQHWFDEEAKEKEAAEKKAEEAETETKDEK